ncbi:MAG: HpcH/HpaI aldolase/citrate lyase family protein [Saprospiraceae bacterium]|nr:HpcH/HpaI aldolase/citrate lyase family protein [Candidatus Opimibacter skivensis]
MSNTTATAGNKGEKDRSDCFVSLQLTSSGGIAIDLTSKVEVLFGEVIRTLCLEVLHHFGIENAQITLEDKGALPFVMAARLEAAIVQLVKTDKEYLPEMLPENLYSSSREQHRLSRLYLPGNTPSLMINAGIHSPNAIILDLEDAVAVHKKSEARVLVRNALRHLSFMGVERMVRINQVPAGLDDLNYIIPHNVNAVVVPKCESAEQIHEVNKRIDILQKSQKTPNQVWVIPIVESALGIIKSYEIATAADNVVALAIGLEDYTADLGIQRTNEGLETLFARSQVINACKAAGIQALDSVFSDVGDAAALKTYARQSKSIGFDGMGCIHPRQLKDIHEGFAPDEREIENAKKIMVAFAEATDKGLGVVSLGTKMIDAPVVKRAQRVINLAISLGKLQKDWRDNEHQVNSPS